MNGTMESVVIDSGATPSYGTETAHFILAGRRSDKVFQVPTGQIAAAMEVKLSEHNFREPARSVHIVPDMKKETLLSTGKFADAGCITIFQGDEVRIFNGETTTVDVTGKAILHGWRDPETGLYRVPL